MLNQAMNVRLAVQGWWLLLYVDLVMRMHGFAKLHERVRRVEVHRSHATPFDAKTLAHLIDVACVLYFKPVLCLQRSAALTVLMRRYGLAAELVIGAQLFPFSSHAWVEWNGHVANDSPDKVRLFHVLERC